MFQNYERARLLFANKKKVSQRMYNLEQAKDADILGHDFNKQRAKTFRIVACTMCICNCGLDSIGVGIVHSYDSKLHIAS